MILNRLVVILGLFLCSPMFSIPEGDKFFVIIVPSYNNEMWYLKNLDSIFSQKYENYRVIYINDASTDRTGELVQQYLKDNHLENKCTYIENRENQGALYNIYHAIHSCLDYEIVLLVDGDDWLKHPDVLSRVNEEYKNENIWLTYGQFEWFPVGNEGFCVPYPEDAIKYNKFREAVWVSTHLRTFYAKLFKQVKKKDLLYKGIFFKVAWDLAMIYPMLEMAQERHSCIPDILYVYNNQNPLNDSKLYAEEQLLVDAIVRKKDRYFRLSNLW